MTAKLVLAEVSPGVIEVVAGVRMIPVRTPTLPPATHTNAVLVGTREAVLVEPATPYPEEIDRLVSRIDELRQRDGLELRAILATHHHPDHIGGAAALKARLGLPLWGHPRTIERTREQGCIDVSFDQAIDDGSVIALEGPVPRSLLSVHTPGHAPGHLCFFETQSRIMIAGDMVAGVGTILVEPNDGDMALYLESLERMRKLEPIALLPAHGDVITEPQRVLGHYIEHRLQREERIRQALIDLSQGVTWVSTGEILPLAYEDVPKAVWPLAVLSIEAHLLKLQQEGRVQREGNGWRSALD